MVVMMVVMMMMKVVVRVVGPCPRERWSLWYGAGELVVVSM
jgi:hypothetical protein